MCPFHLIIDLPPAIITFKASGRDCTNKNELLHEIWVLQRYDMQLFAFYKRFDGAVSKTVLLKEFENKVEGSSPNKTFFFAFANMQDYMFAEKSMV